MTVQEKAWVAKVRSLPCVLCQYLGAQQAAATNVHHVREGQGLSQRASHFLVVALCRGYHQGPQGWHGLGRQRFYERYKLEELDLLAMTIEALQ